MISGIPCIVVTCCGARKSILRKYGEVVCKKDKHRIMKIIKIINNGISPKKINRLICLAPTQLYFTHRKGLLHSDELPSIQSPICFLQPYFWLCKIHTQTFNLLK